MKTPLRPCPVCENNLTDVLDSQRFILPENHPLRDGYDVVCCARCGFAYADTAVTQADYDHFYARHSKYSDAKTSTGSGLSRLDAARLRETADQIVRFSDHRDLRIADIGCANGGLLAELRTLGYSHLCGVDPSEACVANTRLIPGVDAFVGGLSALPVSAGKFDAIILSHVLEHVRDLRPVLRGLHGFLRPGGWLYVETPDAARYAEFVPAPFQDFNTEHINHFSPASMDNLLRQGGFEPVETGTKTIFSAPDMPYPALFVFAKVSAVPPVLHPDPTLRERLVEYIRISREGLARMNARLAATLRGHEKIAVWGTGQLTLKLLAGTALSGVKITQFLDRNPVNHGHCLRGVPVVSPDEFTDRAIPILVASTINASAIIEDIRRMNFPNPLLTLSTD